MTRVAAIGAALLALASTACGTDEEAAARQRENCIALARATAAFEVVQRYYNDGKLGTPEQVSTEMQQVDVPGVDAEPSVRPDGSLVPYGGMTAAQRDTFDAWRQTPRIDAIVGEVVQSARFRAERDADDSC